MANFHQRTPSPHPKSRTARLNWLILAIVVCLGAGLATAAGYNGGGLAGAVGALGFYIAAVISLALMGRDIERSNKND